MPDRQALEKFAAKKYRDGYLQSRVRGFIAYQIQALREKLALTQAQFAELTGKKQSTISRLEDTEYGKVSVQTLLDIACAANVALVVKFASYPEFLDQTRNMSVEALQPRTIQETLSERQSAKIILGEYEQPREETKPTAPPSQAAVSDNSWQGSATLQGGLGNIGASSAAANTNISMTPRPPLAGWSGLSGSSGVGVAA